MEVPAFRGQIVQTATILLHAYCAPGTVHCFKVIDCQALSGVQESGNSLLDWFGSGIFFEIADKLRGCSHFKTYLELEDPHPKSFLWFWQASVSHHAGLSIGLLGIAAGLP